ncbi:lysozyme [Leptothrix discophora]|uniref:Lysozyme n=1 Tax=Leptothrix discophora TaxID=89 RepID=A0ABT9G2D7_LEPDI|nr:lysozyme [Leptothrix discophora]MDP4300333.1 lysozyme [Leptothrix discophora]
MAGSDLAPASVPGALLALIRRFEGCRLVAYTCPAGIWTCGWGSTGPDVGPGTVWTQAQADARLLADAGVCTTGTTRLCPGLSGDPLAAIADFAYNLGLTRLAGSTLRRRLREGDMAGAADELRKWVRGGGRVLPGLVRRREAEAVLLNRGLPGRGVPPFDD